MNLSEVMEWAQVQSKYLRSPSTRLVLWYLCVNAFKSDDNPEGVDAGRVMSGRVSFESVRRGTGLGERTIRNSLHELQDGGYIIAQMSSGRGKSKIWVYWTPLADDLRDDVRAGIKELPKPFKRVQKAPPKALQSAPDAIILEFPNRQDLPV